MLAEISYEALSLDQLCAAAHLTKGAFYRRFESKDAFFLALQRLALNDAAAMEEDLASRLGEDAHADHPLARSTRRVVDAMRRWHLRHCGVLRASVQRRDHTADGWRPFKDYARSFVEHMAQQMVRLPGLRGDRQATARLRIAFQCVISTMVNAALNDPGPLHLGDEAMTDALAEMVWRYMLAGNE